MMLGSKEFGAKPPELLFTGIFFKSYGILLGIILNLSRKIKDNAISLK